MSGEFRMTRAASRSALIPVIVILVVLAGAILRVAMPDSRASHQTWMAGLVITGLPIAWRTVRGVFRGHFATDVVATLAILSAIPLGEPLAGLIVVLMQTGGEALERHAEGRASQAVRALEEDAPRIAHRTERGATTDLPVDDIRVGDELLIRPGEMVPCDCEVIDGRSHVDTSRITGEPIPVVADLGVRLLSGSLNVDGALAVRAAALARESQYARIVELVRSAEASKAPLQRLADRYAVWFTPITLVVCVLTWLASGDASRVLAVLVVATPCPLILATPIAIIGGINRAASRQVIMRTGGALERLDHLHIAVFDKTGTLTVGQPRVARVIALPGFNDREVLRLAAAVEQRSGHSLARPVVDAAIAGFGSISTATVIVETAGQGVSGVVDGRPVAVGSRHFILSKVTEHPDHESDGDASLRAWVAIDGRVAGLIDYADRIRPEAHALIDQLGHLGIHRSVLLSGDDEQNTNAVAEAVGISEAHGGLLPGDKVERIASLAATGKGVLMVGDGTNDAPALSRADVGIALAGHGGGITAEAADVVILNDDLLRVAEAVSIGQRTMRIARQSIWVGLGLSGVAMLAASAGMITPVVGALLQEVIDVAVIVNALRTSVGGSTPSHQPMPAPELASAERSHEQTPYGTIGRRRTQIEYRR